MRILNGRGFGMIAAVLLHVSLAAAAGNLEAKPFPNEVIAKFEAYGGSEFQELCRKVRLPCVQELDGDPASWPLDGKRLSVKDATQKEILDQIIRRYPGFSWEFIEGVVVMRPARSEKQTEDLLERRLESFSSEAVRSDIAMAKIFFSAKLPLSNSYFGAARMFKIISPSLKDVTVREAIRAVAKLEGQAAWTIRNSGKGFFSLGYSSWRERGGCIEVGNDGKPKCVPEE